MSRIALFTDSTAYIPPELVQRYHITVVPQVLIWGTETFEDGVDIQPNEFYARLKTASIMPTTSQVTVAKVHQIFQQLLEQDCQVLAILVSEKLSGTINSAVQAKNMLPAGAPVEIVNSETIAMALGFQVLAAARAVEQGASLSEAVALTHEAIRHTGLIMAVDTLEFLHRGGRIGGASRFLGTALNIKPILEIRDGRVEALERVRTRSKSLARVVELVEEKIAGRTPVRLASLHANAEEDAHTLMELTRPRINAVESVISMVSPVVGTHTGPGAVGLAYMAGM